ncbi:autophagy-like protein 12 [Cladophialophora psammophila CBS 110553]|uniref:Ubiquitin-like protein ATG12 n=1 Tax=Cladophialophora psammophila CBS 110553 TaxID=1182543 RepID=W9X7B5_9EURO|nr:autophagy-like protein 12 [Cladophialophora psammophila CBS 110553]EXJ72821.1 autophagy-like protein 12 [Cladophialophora psammophila CBS 110553]
MSSSSQPLRVVLQDPGKQHGAHTDPNTKATDNDSGNGSNGEDDSGPGGDLPMSMTASVMLTNLPKDASQALKEAEEIDDRKVSVRFQPIGSAPILKQRVFKISASSKFSVVLNFLRKKVGVKEGDGLFCYVNSVFAPGLDEGVGNLYRVRFLSPCAQL